jgi:hypothetical protein
VAPQPHYYRDHVLSPPGALLQAISTPYARRGELAVRLYDRLGAAGAPRQILVVLHGDHLLARAGGPIAPGRVAIVRSIADFFDRWAGRAGGSTGHEQ